MNPDYSMKAAFRLALFIFKVMFCLTFLLSIVAALVLSVAFTIRTTHEHKQSQAAAMRERLQRDIQSSKEREEWEAAHAKMVAHDAALSAQAKMHEQPAQSDSKPLPTNAPVLFDVSSRPLQLP